MGASRRFRWLSGRPGCTCPRRARPPLLPPRGGHAPLGVSAGRRAPGGPRCGDAALGGPGARQSPGKAPRVPPVAPAQGGGVHARPSPRGAAHSVRAGPPGVKRGPAAGSGALSSRRRGARGATRRRNEDARRRGEGSARARGCSRRRRQQVRPVPPRGAKFVRAAPELRCGRCGGSHAPLRAPSVPGSGSPRGERGRGGAGRPGGWTPRSVRRAGAPGRGPWAALCARDSCAPATRKPGPGRRGVGSAAEKWGTMQASNFRKSL